MVNLINQLTLLISVLLALTCHEFAHGYAAYKMGDDTAQSEGRLTLNPLKHIDIFGAICLYLFHFGWAKPVPINPYLFRDRKKGLIVVSLAGPLTNIVLSFISYFIVVVIVTFVKGAVLSTGLSILVSFLSVFSTINLGLGIFNLIPIPPLDGSKILVAYLPENIKYKFFQLERYGMLILMLLLYFNVLTPILVVAREAILASFQFVIKIILGWIF